jgi:tetratricopeptide (TPR) repeat protein
MTRRTLSIPVFVLSLVGLAAALAGFHFVRQWQLARLSKTLLTQSHRAQEDKQWVRAAEHLDRYLRLQPQNQAARVQLALVFAKGAAGFDDKQRAVALHYRALASALGAQEDELRGGLAELLLETNRLLEAENEARGLIERLGEQPQALRVYALSLYFQWRSGALASKRPADLKLLNHVEKALAKNPGDIPLSEIAATLYRDFPDVVTAYRSGLNQLSRAQIADTHINRVVELKPRDAKAHLSRHVYRAKYGLPGSEEDLTRALALAPNDAQVLLVAASFYYHRAQADLAAQDGKASQPAGDAPRSAKDVEHDLTTARKLYEHLIADKLVPGNLEPHLRLGDVRVLEGKLDAALEIWRSALGEFTQPVDQAVCHARIADHLLSAGRIDESRPALEAIEAILATLGGTISREQHLSLMQSQGLRRATYYLHHGRHSEAIGEVQQAIARQPQFQPDAATSHFAWDLLGRGYAGLEDWTEAATAFDRAANFQPHALTTRLAAARAWLFAGRCDLAVDRAEQLLEQQPQAEALIILATAEMQNQSVLAPVERSWGRVQQALASLERMDTSGLEAPWRIDFLRADYIAMRTPTADQPAYGAGAATEVLRLAETKYEEGSQFWFEACMAYERLGQIQDAERAWERLNQIPGARTEAAIAASRRAAIHQDFTAANRILEDAGTKAPPQAKLRLRQELLRIAQARQDLPQMRSLLRAELVERPHDVGVLCRLAELDMRDGDYVALEQWERRLKDAGYLGELWARYFLVVRLYSSAKDKSDPVLKEALAEQSRLATLRPNWAESYALRGAIEQKMERLEAAVAAYEQAIALGERRYSVFEQLVSCLDRLNRPGDVEKYLARLESYLPASQRLTEIAAGRHLERDRPERAIEIARRAANERPQDLQAQLWLGRLLLMNNNLDEARTVFEQATKASPSDVRSWNGLFNYHLRMGEREQARQVLESMRTQSKLDPVELDLVLGQAHLRMGESAEAMRLFASLSEQAPNRADVHLQLARLFLETDREKAKEYLQKAIELDPKLAQARWLLAAILAGGGSEAELAQAEQLLGGSDESAAATTEDRRVRALLLAQHGDADGLDRAIRILEQIIAEGSEIINDRLLLAQFLERQAEATPDPKEAADKIRAAREQFLTVASRDRAQVADVAVLVAFLLRQDDKLDAGVWLDRLEERIRTQAKDDGRAIAALIELRIKHGTIEQCEPWVARLEQFDRDPIRPMVARVKLLLAQGKKDQIEKLIEAKAKAALDIITDPHVRGRVARAVGDLYLVANMLLGAERWYRVVVREDKEQFPVLALTLIRQGRAREAIRLCQAATEHDSTSRPAVVLTTILLEAGGKPEQMELAEPMLAEALAKFPEDANLLYGVGMLRVLGDRYPEAIELLRKVIKLNPRHISALNNLAVLVAETPDQRSEAIELIDQAIELRGQQPTLIDTKGTILVLGGRSSESTSLLEAAARGVHSDPRHKFHLAMAYHDVGAVEKAREHLHAALKQELEGQILTPTDRKALDRLRTALLVTSSPGSQRER